MSKHRYNVTTWDSSRQRFTDQAGLPVPSKGITKGGLKRALIELGTMGYCVRTFRDDTGKRVGDPAVLVESQKQ